MSPRIKRLWLRGSLLGLVMNAVFLFLQYQAKGILYPRDWLVAAKSLGATVAAIAVLAFLFSRVGEPPPK